MYLDTNYYCYIWAEAFIATVDNEDISDDHLINVELTPEVSETLCASSGVDAMSRVCTLCVYVFVGLYE
jgi:hypothetical protein